MMTPGAEKMLVSVIIPSYNHAPFLQERLQTVLMQTYGNIELLILDDCSTDGSAQIIEKYRDNPRVRLIELSSKNSGSPFAQWKKGIKLSKGEFIWIAESDDSCSPDFLDSVMPALEEDPLCVLSFCASLKTDASGKPLGVHPNQKRMKSLHMDGRRFARKHLAYKNAVVNASGAVFRKSAALSLQEDFESFRGVGDHVFWAALALKGNVAYCSRPLNYFRFHASNTTAAIKATPAGLKEAARLAVFLRDAGISSPLKYRYFSTTVQYSLKYRCPQATSQEREEIQSLLQPDLVVRALMAAKRLKRIAIK